MGTTGATGGSTSSRGPNRSPERDADVRFLGTAVSPYRLARWAGKKTLGIGVVGCPPPNIRRVPALAHGSDLSDALTRPGSFDKPLIVLTSFPQTTLGHGIGLRREHFSHLLE